MRILIVGAWFTNIYEEPLAKGFEKLGYEVHRFKWSEYFRNAHLDHYRKERLNWAEIFYYKFQNKFLCGPVMRKINSDLLRACQDFRPAIVFLYRATHIRRSTIKKIKETSKAIFVSYHNDDPFASQNRLYNRNYIASLPMMDFNYVYRAKNIQDVNKLTTHCEILLPYPNTDFIYPLRDINKKYDVVFIGHYEDDGRDQMICDLIADESVNFMLFGTNWHLSSAYQYIYNNLGKIKPVYNEDYNRTLNEAKIALCFLSTLNNDRYTRRTFEIPASGTLLLSQYTEESAKILTPDEEAAYFNSSEKLVEKVHFYLSNDSERERVARNGYNKVIHGGHTYNDRASQVIERIKQNIFRVLE